MTDKRNLLINAVPGCPGRFDVFNHAGAVSQKCQHTEISSLILAYAHLNKVNTVNVTFCFGEKDEFWDNFQLAESLTTVETKKEPGAAPAEHELLQQAIEIIDQQLNGVIDATTARSAWYAFTEQLDNKGLAKSLTFALHNGIERACRKVPAAGIGIKGIPVASNEQQKLSEVIASMNLNVIALLRGGRDLTRAHKYWSEGLEAIGENRLLLTEMLIQVIADIRECLREEQQR